MGKIADKPDLRDRTEVFQDREHGGRVLSEMLQDCRGRAAVVLAVPAGGLPVAAEIARTLDLPLDVAVVSKITLPWNTEAGYGAVAFDGTVRLNDPLIRRLGLTEEDIRKGVDKTRKKVASRLERLRGKRPFPDIEPISKPRTEPGEAPRSIRKARRGSMPGGTRLRGNAADRDAPQAWRREGF